MADPYCDNVQHTPPPAHPGGRRFSTSAEPGLSAPSTAAFLPAWSSLLAHNSATHNLCPHGNALHPNSAIAPPTYAMMTAGNPSTIGEGMRGGGAGAYGGNCHYGYNAAGLGGSRSSLATLTCTDTGDNVPPASGGLYGFAGGHCRSMSGLSMLSLGMASSAPPPSSHLAAFNPCGIGSVPPPLSFSAVPAANHSRWGPRTSCPIHSPFRVRGPSTNVNGHSSICTGHQVKESPSHTIITPSHTNIHKCKFNHIFKSLA